MNERWLIPSFTASSLIHLGLIPHRRADHARQADQAGYRAHRADRRVARRATTKKIEVAPPPPPPPAPKPKPKPQNITAPKLLSKPVFETSPLPPTGNTKEEIKEKPHRRAPAAGVAAGKRRLGARPAGIPAPRRPKPKAAPRAPAISSARAMSVWSGQRCRRRRRWKRKLRLGSRSQRRWHRRRRRHREKRFRVWLGRSAAIKSSRAIPSRPAERERKALRRCAFACWKTAGWARCSSISRPDFAISIWRRWKRSRNGSSSRRAGARIRYPSGSCCR